MSKYGLFVFFMSHNLKTTYHCTMPLTYEGFNSGSSGWLAELGSHLGCPKWLPESVPQMTQRKSCQILEYLQEIWGCSCKFARLCCTWFGSNLRFSVVHFWTSWSDLSMNLKNSWPVYWWNKKQCSRQLQCKVPCSISNVINSSLFINSSLSSLSSTSHAVRGGGGSTGGLWPGGGPWGRGQGTFWSSCHILHYHMVLRPKGTLHNQSLSWELSRLVQCPKQLHKSTFQNHVNF